MSGYHIGKFCDLGPPLMYIIKGLYTKLKDFCYRRFDTIVKARTTAKVLFFVVIIAAHG